MFVVEYSANTRQNAGNDSVTLLLTAEAHLTIPRGSKSLGKNPCQSQRTPPDFSVSF